MATLFSIGKDLPITAVWAEDHDIKNCLINISLTKQSDALNEKLNSFKRMFGIQNRMAKSSHAN